MGVNVLQRILHASGYHLPLTVQPLLHLIAGFAVTTLVAAVAFALPVRLGAELEHVAAVVFGIAGALLPAGWLATRVKSERHLRCALFAAAIAGFSAPVVLRWAESLALASLPLARGLGQLPILAGISAATVGVVALVAWLATVALAAHGDRPGDGWIGCGVVVALLVAPFLMHRSPGAVGSMRLAGVAFSILAAARYAATPASDARAIAPLPRERALPLLLGGLGAATVGLVAGRTSALIDGLLLGSPFAAMLTPAALGLGCVLVTSLAVGSARARIARATMLAAPWIVAGFALGRILPRPPGSTVPTLVLLCGLTSAWGAAVALSLRARRVALALTLVAGVLVAAKSRPLEIVGGACEADGAWFESRRDSDRELAWLDGVPLHLCAPDPQAAARIVSIGLCQIEDPERALVLGAGGAEFARALVAGTRCDVTWVTPLLGEAATESRGATERLAIVHATERAWLEREPAEFDCIVISPPTRAPRRMARTLTTEFARLVERHLTSRGLALQIFNCAELDRDGLLQQLLPTSGFSAYRCFVDHPASPAPLVARCVGQGADGPLIELLERRHSELMPRLSALSAADLDARGVLQCHLFDSSILDLWYGESWLNRDDCPSLARFFRPLGESTPMQRALMLTALHQRRTSIAESMRDLAPEHPRHSTRYTRLHRTIDRDFEAAHQVMAFGVERAVKGDVQVHAGAIFPVHLLPRLLPACAASPDLPLARLPVERMISWSAAQKDEARSLQILNALEGACPDDLGIQLRLGQAEAWQGHLAAAERRWLKVLETSPGNASAATLLAFQIAGEGRGKRRDDARDYLARLLEAATQGPPPVDAYTLDHARAIHAGLQRDFASARENSERLPPVIRSLALLRYFAFPRSPRR